MYKVGLVTRKKFLDWIAHNELPKLSNRKSLAKVKAPSENEVMLIFSNDSDEALPTLCVRDQSVGDFIAFANTYIGNYSPFTAFFDVVAYSDLSSVFAVKTELRGKQLPTPLVSAAMIEAFVKTDGALESLDDVSLTWCQGTLSFTLLRALRYGVDRSVFNSLPYRWREASYSIGTDQYSHFDSEVLEFWHVISEVILDDRQSGNLLNKFSNPCYTFVYEQLFESNFNQNTWTDLTNSMPELRNAPEQMQGSREQRISLLEKYTGIIANSGEKDPLTRIIGLSYLMSMAAHGSFEYLGLISGKQSQSSTAMFFGLFTACHPDSNYLENAYCLGRFLDRNLTQPQVASDVSLMELPILLEQKKPDFRLRAINPSYLNVEIYPNLNVPFRIRKSSSSSTASKSNFGSKQAMILDNRVMDVRGQLMKALDIIQDISKIAQQDLFDKNGRR